MPSMSSTIPRKRPAETQEDAWVADEDRFVLRQAKKKALLRVKAGRGKAIDLLTVTLRTVDQSRAGFESDDDEEDAPIVNPEAVFEGLDREDLEELEKGIDTYLALEKSRANHDFWQTMKLVCKDKRQLYQGNAHFARGLSSVAPELDKVLEPKNLEQLEALEKQVRHKLRNDDSIDVDYWENLLKRLTIHKARAKLRKVSQDVVGSRLDTLKKQQAKEAALLQESFTRSTRAESDPTSPSAVAPKTAPILDPPPLLKLTKADGALKQMDMAIFARDIHVERQRVMKAGYIPAKTLRTATSGDGHAQSSATPGQRDAGKSTSAAYEREVARGVGEGEEVFALEEVVPSSKKPWAEQYRPRKPRYFNRVQMGYEWNKYNQTHYDQDNPPPKVVQGYKFNVFYPDLIDKVKAPTYRIERENGRKRGQTFAPAGEDDTCVIRFIAGAPYDDLAFRIVDREWDYSAKRERGFRSSFDKVSSENILVLRH